MPRAASGLAVFVVGLVVAAPVAAQSTATTAASQQLTLSTSLPPESGLSGSLPPDPSLETTPVRNAPSVLGAPVAPANRASQPQGPITPASGVTGQLLTPDTELMITPVRNYQPPPQGSRAAVLGISSSDGTPLPSYAIDPGLSPPVITAAPTADPNDFLKKRADDRKLPSPFAPDSEHSSDKFGGELGEKINGILGKPSDWFKSDHAFDGFISPVTNPFLFEDPRSLTEVRPIFLIEKIPNSQADFHGGNTFFFGTQLRLAITDRLSFTINKFGLESFNPGSGSDYGSNTGFAEFWFGPKYTFIRNENTGSLLAGGLQFQIPTGDHGNFQDTGSLSLVPYVSYAQNFLRDFSAGSFNGMMAAGYSFSVNNERSDYFYFSAHIDMNVLNLNKFFPLLELNWFAYTSNGRETPIGIEGQDLINFGGHAAGTGLLTGAIGGRYKISENYQLGAAFEIPFAGPHDINAYRFTLDFIFRY